MKKGCYYLSFVFLLLLASCEHAATITYKIRNNAYDPIIVIASTTGKKTNDTILIRYNELKTVAVQQRGTGGVRQYKETGAMLQGFGRLDIYRDDTLSTSKTDFRKASLWTWDEKGSHAAEYTAVVIKSDF